jgi:hypothetical protein
MQLLITLTSDDVCHVAGPQRWMDAIELVAFGNRDSEGLAHVHISIFEGQCSRDRAADRPAHVFAFSKVSKYEKSMSAKVRSQKQ